MEYSNELLALFHPSQFQQSNPEWLQPGNLPGTELDAGENYDENYSYPSKYHQHYPNDSFSNCISSRSSFNGQIDQMGPSTLGYAQNSQFFSDDQEEHYGLEDRKPQSAYTEPDLIMAQITQRSSPLEVPAAKAQKRQKTSQTRTNSSSSSTRRSSSITSGVEAFPNYTTSPKAWAVSGSPRKKSQRVPSMYLGHFEGPKYRPDAPKKYELVRGIASGAVTRPPYSSQKTNIEYVPVELKIVGASVDEINRTPWSFEERQDGRRIIRMERRQTGHVISASFSVVGSALEHPEPEKAPPDVGVVEVSCLNYLSLEDEESGIRFSITSVEVVNIIEALIASTTMSAGSLRKEKGRIRSNLMPFWSKKPLSSKKSATRERSDSRRDFARRIMRYDIRKPRGFDKDVRILAWDKLVPALHRALQCYYAEVPKEDLVDSDAEKEGGAMG